MLAPITTQRATLVGNGIGGGIFKWMAFHDISREFRQIFDWWEWWITIMRLHDERWWKYGWYQTLCEHDMHPSALKPSHSMQARVLSNHVKFRCIQAQVEGISTLAPFTVEHATSVDNGINDGLVGRCSMTFQDSFDKDSIDRNVEWWQWDCTFGSKTGSKN